MWLLREETTLLVIVERPVGGPSLRCKVRNVAVHEQLGYNVLEPLVQL